MDEEHRELIDKFTTAYATCALWSSTDDNEEPLDNNYNIDDISPTTLTQMIADCADFQTANAGLLDHVDVSLEQAGHDFWLTRNRHGAGFWDRGLGVIGGQLTKAAHAYMVGLICMLAMTAKSTECDNG